MPFRFLAIAVFCPPAAKHEIGQCLKHHAVLRHGIKHSPTSAQWSSTYAVHLRCRGMDDGLRWSTGGQAPRRPWCVLMHTRTWVARSP